MNIIVAVDTLRSELKKDNEFYNSYHATIMMSVYDEAIQNKIKIPHKQLLKLSNGSATRFLQLFIED